MSSKGQSKAAFGRRGRAVEPPEVPTYRKARATRPLASLALASGTLILFLAGFGAVHWALPEMAALEGESAQAEQRVVEIVNQPVTHLPRTAAVGTVFSPGWFHPGAIKPDFGTVDIRKSQDLLYDRYTYVTSNLNPTEMFIGHELEFNAMTKYFYTDRTLPKKRLSESEMLEINRLYRVIGRDEQPLTLWRASMAGVLALALFASFVLVRRTRRAAS